MSSNPWIKMWTAPRETIREVIQFNPNHRLYWLAALYGFPLLLNLAQSSSLGVNFAWPLIFILAAILSPVVGMISFTISSALVYWVGKWLKGQGRFKEVRASIAWSNVTNMGTILLWFFLFAQFGTDLFLRNFPETPFAGIQAVFANGAFLIQSILSIWSFVLLLWSLAEVQKFSVWKAIVNVILPFVMITVAVWILMMIFMSVGGMQA